MNYPRVPTRDGIDRIRQVSMKTVESMGNMVTGVINMQSSFNTVNTAVEAQASNGRQILEAHKQILTLTIR
jgi:hypothetical protein